MLQRVRAVPPLETQFDRWLLTALLALLCFGPLAFGAVEPWATFLQELGAAALASAWLVRLVTNRHTRFHPNPLYGPLLAIGLLLTVQLALHVPAYQHAFLSAVLTGTTYVLIFFVANQVFRNPAAARSTARVFIIFGAALALYSILQSFAAPEKLLGFRSTRPIGTAFGPYVNHNHFAGLMEMLAPFALVLATRSNLSLHKRLIYAAAGSVMAGSILLSQSRGGMLAFVVQLALLSILAMESAPRHKSKIRLALAALVFMGLAGIAISRVSVNNSEVSFALRKQIAADSLRMTTTRPWLGWGLGNFAVVYPQFRSFYTNQAVRAAHNDYLQWLTEVGTVGGVLGLWFLLLLYRHGWRHFARWNSNSASSAKLAALLGITGIAIHALSDFNLHIPANAAIFFALCAMTTVKSETPESSSRARLLGVTALVGITALALLATRSFIIERFTAHGDLAHLRRAVQLDSHNADIWRLLAAYETDPVAALSDLRRATTLNSHDAAAWLALANADEVLGDVRSAQSAVSEALKADPKTPIYLGTAANLYLSMGEQQPALRLLRKLAENDPESLPDTVALAWRATRNPETVLTQVLPSNVAGRLQFLNLLVRNNEASADMVWRFLASEPVSFPRGSVSPYVDFLLQQSRGRDAKDVWQHLNSDANRRSSDENLITNGSFEQEISNDGFDWRYEPSTGVAVLQPAGGAHSGSHSLELSFSGAVDAINVRQFVAVQPNTEYQFEGYFKASGFESASEVVFSVFDAKSGAELAHSGPISISDDWSAFTCSFSVPPNHDLVILKLVPTVAGKQMRGQIWLDDLSLKPIADSRRQVAGSQPRSFAHSAGLGNSPRLRPAKMSAKIASSSS